MVKNQLAVVILNYNGKHLLEKFLPSVVDHSSPYQIYVADNNSSDTSIEFLRENYPNVLIVKNNKNYGYAKGYNEALKKIDAKYYVLINSDVEVTKNWITPIVDLMERDPSVAACQPKILDYTNPKQFEYAGASGGYIDKYGYPFCRGRLFNAVEDDKAQFNDTTEIFWATGACLFVRSSAFIQVGGFDENYFAHMEEIDLCWRLRNFRHKIYVVPQSTVFHLGGGTLNKLSKAKTYLNFRNNLTTFTKNHPSKYLFIKVFFRLLLDGVAAFKFLIDGQPKHFYAVLRAHFTYYAWLPATIAKRRQLKKTAGFEFTNQLMYKGNVVAEHFLRGKSKFTDLKRGFFS